MGENAILTSKRQIIDNYNNLSIRNIFICHDGLEFSGVSKKWVSLFIEYLEAFLNRISNDNYKIYSTGIKDVDIKEVVAKSNVFIFIIGPEIKEHSSFKVEADLINRKQLETAETTLIIKLIYSPLPETRQPAFLSSIEGNIFYEVRDDNVEIKRLNEKSDITSKVIQGKIADLAYDIDKFFNGIKGQILQIMPCMAVYLAETTPDQTDNRNILKREIEQFGYQVLPDKPLPDNEAEFKNAVQNYIRKSIFSVHIIGQDYGETPVGEVHSKVDLQNMLVFNYIDKQRNSFNNFSRLIWITPDLKIASDVQRQYVEKLRRSEGSLNKMEVIQAPLIAFKSLVMNKIMEFSYNKPISKNGQSDKPKVYIIHEQSDTGLMGKIAEYFIDQSIEPILTFYSEKENIINKHRQNLTFCDAAFIYNSRTNSSWLKSKIADLFKAPGYGRSKPFSAKAIFMAQPINDLDMSLLDDFIFLSQNRDISFALKPFCDKLIQNQ